MLIFYFFKKTPVHQVISYNEEKHVEESLFEANQMQLSQTKTNSKGAQAFTLAFNLTFQILFVIVHKEKWYQLQKETTICIPFVRRAEIAKPAKKKYDNHSY